MSNPAASAAAAAAAPAAIAAVGIKIPDFWTTDPGAWFLAVEAQFHTAHITVSSTKFYHVLQKLPQELIASVRDIVTDITATEDPYGLLKTRLVKSYTPSKWHKIFSLIHHSDIGDRRPSVLMAAMVALLPTSEVTGLLFQGLFLERLPADMRDHLTTRDFETVRQMADYADLLWDGRQGRTASSVISAVNAAPSSTSNRRRRNSPGQHRRGRTATPGPASGSDGLCFYHGRFGLNAHKCEQPCSWSGNAPAAGGN